MPPGGWQAPLASPQSAWAGQPLASWGSRVGAALLDVIIVMVPIIAICVIVALIVAAGSGVGAFVFLIIASVAFLLAALFYAPVLMARPGERNGQTWGKQIVGIAAVRDTGQPIELGFGFLREFVVQYLLFWVVGGFFLYIPTLLDYLWPLWDDQNRCLHDMIVSTHVVQRGS